MSFIKSAVVLCLAVLIFLLSKMIPGLLFSFSPGLSAIPSGQEWMLFPALLIEGAGLSLIVLYICRTSYFPKRRLIFQLTLVYIIINTVLVQMETVYFREAFPVITDGDLVKLFAAGIIHGLIFVPASVFFLRTAHAGGDGTAADFTTVKQWWIYLLSVFLYIVLYLGFGFLAQLAPPLRQEYAEWIIDPIKTQLLPLFQIIRGAGFTLSAVLIFRMFSRRKQALTAASLLFAFCISLSLIGPNSIMGPALRLVHFFEITCSMLLYGVLSGLLLTKKTAED